MTVLPQADLPLLGGFADISVWDIELSEFSHQVLGGFGKAEVEIAAGKLILFLRHRGQEWRAFGLGELIKFYQQQRWNYNEMLFGLLGDWLDDDFHVIEPPRYVVHCGEYLAVTYEFIHRCFYHEPTERKGKL